MLHHLEHISMLLHMQREMYFLPIEAEVASAATDMLLSQWLLCQDVDVLGNRHMLIFGCCHPHSRSPCRLQYAGCVQTLEKALTGGASSQGDRCHLCRLPKTMCGRIAWMDVSCGAAAAVAAVVSNQFGGRWQVGVDQALQSKSHTVPSFPRAKLSLPTLNLTHSR